MVRGHRSSEDVARAWATAFFWSGMCLGSLVIVYVLSLFRSRPWFMSMLSMVLVLLWHYLTNDDSRWHHSQYQENQFWMLVTSLAASTLVFAPDTPISVSSLTGCCVVSLMTMAAHVIDKDHHRKRLLRRSDYPSSATRATSTAGDKIRELELLVNMLDSKIPYSFWNMTHYVSVSRKILSIFTSASKEELNAIMLTSEMKLLAYKLKNHNKTTASSLDFTAGIYTKRNRYRSALMEVLATTRVSDLCLPARAIVLDMIQGLRLSNHPDTETEAQHWIANLLLTVKGDELSDLKQLVDNKGSAESMHKLIFQDLCRLDLRKRVLEHFRQ